MSLAHSVSCRFNTLYLIWMDLHSIFKPYYIVQSLAPQRVHAYWMLLKGVACKSPLVSEYILIEAYWKCVHSLFVSFPQKRNGIVFSLGVNYLHSDLQ